MQSNPVAEGNYRIRKAGAKSDIAKSISNGKKCHYVQIGIELFNFGNLEEAIEFVEGKGLVADPMSLDFGAKPSKPDDNDDDEDDDEATSDDDDEAISDDDFATA